MFIYFCWGMAIEFQKILPDKFIFHSFTLQIRPMTLHKPSLNNNPWYILRQPCQQFIIHLLAKFAKRGHCNFGGPLLAN
jgi:hypothetical protein